MEDKALELLEMMDGQAIDEDEIDYLVIDSSLRTISIPESFGVIGVYSDDSVKRAYFKMPRYFNDIDLSEFTAYVNYLHSADTEGGDRYLVTDMKAESSDITFSWLVGRRAFLAKGKLVFNVCLRKYDSDDSSKIIREFNTTISKVNVLEGLETDPKGVVDNSDLVNQLIANWEERFSTAESSASTATADATKAATHANEAAEEASTNAVKALEAANKANAATSNASVATDSANKAAESANASKEFADSAASSANEAANRNDQAVQELTQRVQNGEFNGKPFTFDYIVESIDALNTLTGMSKGEFAIISTDVNLPENAQMYMYDGEVWQYVADFSGSIGISVSSIVQTVESEEDKGVNVWTATLSNGDTFSFNVRNGSKGNKGDQGDKPVRGVDYWTAEDQKPIDEAIQNATDAASLAGISSSRADKAASEAEAAAQRADNVVDAVSKRYGNVLKRITDEAEIQHVEDAYPSDLWGATVYGKSEQKTTSGKNLFNPELMVDKNVYSSNDDGTFQVLSSNNIAWVSVLDEIVLPAGTYTFSGSNNFECRKTDDLSTTFATFNKNTMSVTRTIDEETTFKFKIDYGLSSYPITSKLQIEQGTEATEWEPYTGGKPSPNVDYPQEIESIDSVEVLTTGKSLLDLNSMIAGYVSDNGTVNSNSFNGERTSDYISIDPSTSYSFLYDGNNADNKDTSDGYTKWLGIGFYDSDKNFISRIMASNNVNYAGNNKYSGFEYFFSLVSPQNAVYAKVSARNLSSAKFAYFAKTSNTIIPLIGANAISDNLLSKDWTRTVGCLYIEYGNNEYIESAEATTATFSNLYGGYGNPISANLPAGYYRFSLEQTGGNFDIVDPTLVYVSNGETFYVKNGDPFFSDREIEVQSIKVSKDITFEKVGDHVDWEASVVECESYELCSLPNGTRDELRVDELGNVTLIKNTVSQTVNKIPFFSENEGDPYFFLFANTPVGVNPSEYIEWISSYSVLCNKYFYNSGGNPRIYRLWNQVIVFDNQYSSIEEVNAVIEDDPIFFITERYEPEEISLGTIESLKLPETISNFWINSSPDTTSQITYEQDLSIAVGSLALAVQTLAARV